MQKAQLDVVRKRFENEALSFDAIYRQDSGSLYAIFNRIFRKPIFERYKAAFRYAGNIKDKKVLDVGCGSGIYSVNYALRGAKRVVGIDFSSHMLELARQRASNSDVEDQCSFIQANFLETNLNEKFDVSIAMGVFDYLPDPVTFLHKMKSVTNGVIIASFPGHSLVREPLRKLRYKIGSKGGVYFYSHNDVARIVKRAGISNYSIKPIATGSGFILVART